MYFTLSSVLLTIIDIANTVKPEDTNLSKHLQTYTVLLDDNVHTLYTTYSYINADNNKAMLLLLIIIL